MSEAERINEIAGKHWDKQLEGLLARTVTRVRWWEDETAMRHINGIVGNPNLTGLHAGFHARIASHFDRQIHLKAISVGCGATTKEMWLMQEIDVARFDLFDISQANIAFGQEQAAKQ